MHMHQEEVIQKILIYQIVKSQRNLSINEGIEQSKQYRRIFFKNNIKLIKFYQVSGADANKQQNLHLIIMKLKVF